MKGAAKLAVFLPALLLAACDQGGPTATDFNASVTGPGPVVGTTATPSAEEIDVCKRGPAANVVFAIVDLGPEAGSALSDDGADGSATIAAGTCERIAFNGGGRDTVQVTETVPAGQQLDSIIRQQLTPAGTTVTKFTGTNSVKAFLTGGGTSGEGAVITFYNSLIPPPGDEGCTPGFWKNNALKHGASAWAGSGFTPNQLLGPIFTGELAVFSTQTLVQILGGGGGDGIEGAQEILLRAAVAALLNAGSPNVDYPLTVAQIIAQVNAALATNDRDTILALAGVLDGFNNLGCPIDQN
jgi:hypothetical protein